MRSMDEGLLRRYENSGGQRSEATMFNSNCKSKKTDTDKLDGTKKSSGKFNKADKQGKPPLGDIECHVCGRLWM